MRKELIVFKDPKAPISEIFRTLRTNIQFMNAGKNSNAILITSSMPGEGKSWVSVNLATTFAQMGKKVVLVDADMRKGRQYSILGLSPKPGLSNYLSGVNTNNADVSNGISNYIQKTSIDGLEVMVAGNVPPNPAELIGSENMLSLLSDLKAMYDVVIIDGTPCQLVTDSLILSRIVDSTILVAACKMTKKKDLQKVITGIKNVGGNILGVVLNKIPVVAKEYQKAYYYGSSASDGKHAHDDNKEEEKKEKEEVLK